MISSIEKLRQLIEKSVGRYIKTPKDFTFLSERIYERLHVQISPTTLKRIWGYQQDEGPSRISTLDILAQFCAYPNWDSFVKDCDNSSSQSAVILRRSINVDELTKGNTIQLTWAPNRSCEVEYLGNHQFKILWARNTKLKEGNTFKCIVLLDKYLSSTDMNQHMDTVSNMNYLNLNKYTETAQQAANVIENYMTKVKERCSFEQSRYAHDQIQQYWTDRYLNKWDKKTATIDKGQQGHYASSIRAFCKKRQQQAP